MTTADPECPEFLLFSLIETDSLCIAPTNAMFERMVVEAIVRAWPSGLQASARKLDDQMATYKLHGWRRCA